MNVPVTVVDFIVALFNEMIRSELKSINFFFKNYAWFNMELRNGIRTLLVVRFHNQYFWLQHFHEHWLMPLYASIFFSASNC